jgi:hypothetical protein
LVVNFLVMPRSWLVNVTVADAILLPCGSLMIPETEAVEATVCPDILEEQVANNSTAKATISARRPANGEDGSRNIVMPPESF